MASVPFETLRLARREFAALRAEFKMTLELLRRDMTIRLGGMIVVAGGVIVAAMRILTLHL